MFYFINTHSLISRLLYKHHVCFSHSPRSWELFLKLCSEKVSFSAPWRYTFLLFPHRIYKQNQVTVCVCVRLKALFSCTRVWRIFQNNLSQHSKVLQQQEVVKVGRRPVNICCNYWLVMRGVSAAVWVASLTMLLQNKTKPNQEPEEVSWGPALPHLDPPLGLASDDAVWFFQQLYFPNAKRG